MRTLVVGCNHRSAPVATRERIAFDEAAVPRALQELKQTWPDAEAVLLSTCNRMEIYVARPVEGHPRIDELIRFIAAFHGLEAAEFAERLYSHEDLEAARHLFRVVSSLDSMVVGESQILSQAKSAFDIARSVGTVGNHLDLLFQRALSAAKNIHATTGIASGRLSVGSTAVELARQIFAHFGDKIIFMVGAGKMGELTLTHLLSTRPSQLWVTNRTDQRATELAERLTGRHQVPTRAIPFAQWIDHLAEADIVISSTGAHEPILTAEAFAPVPPRRRYRPLLIIDIAVPRDVDPAVGEHDCVYLYNIDDLQSVTEANLAQRKQALARCQEMIESAVIEFAERQARQDLGPLIHALQEHFSEVGRQELERMMPKLATVSPHDRELIEQMLHRVAQKLLHDPLHLLSNSGNAATHLYADTLRALFNLKGEE